MVSGVIPKTLNQAAELDSRVHVAALQRGQQKWASAMQPLSSGIQQAAHACWGQACLQHHKSQQARCVQPEKHGMPGIGMTSFPRLCTQARASCPAVTPLALASSLIFATAFMFCMQQEGLRLRVRGRLHQARDCEGPEG